jgi:UDP-N-acetylglucosamine:LPS N-acetylglucosamine transferase
VIPESELAPQRLVEEIFALLDEPDGLREMEQAARKFARPNATRDIVNLIESVARR